MADDRWEPPTDGGPDADHGPGAPEPVEFGLEASHPSVDRSRLDDAYGPIRGYFRHRVDRYRDLDDDLRAIRHDEPVDVYLAESARLAGVAALVGVAVGILVGVALLVVGTSRWGLVAALAAALAAPVLGGVLGGGGAWLVRRYRPGVVSRKRRARATDLVLPHAVIFLYALSHGGMDLMEAADRLGDAREEYAEPAATFHDVVTDVHRFDRSLTDALEAARDRAPGDAMTAFLDELVAVIDTGGDVDAFLESEAERHLSIAEREQERLLESLETMAEVYITAVFAGPIFLLITLLVGSFVYPGLLLPMRLVVYALIPAAILTIAAVVSYLYEPYRQQIGAQQATLDALRDGFGGREVRTGNDRIAEYEAARRRRDWRRVLDRPRRTMRERPVTSLLVTVPLGAVAVAVLLVAGVATGVTESPAVAAAVVFTVPFLIAALPFAYFYERKRTYERTVRQRFPDALDVLGDADANDVPLTDSFGIVAERTSGELAGSFDRLRRDVAWQHDVRGAFERFAARLGVPSITRIVRILRESVTTTDDLEPIFAVVAEDLRTRNEIRAKRRRRMQPYGIVAVIGVLVFLAIVVFFESHFLPVIEDLPQRGAEALAGTPLEIGTIDVDTYRELFVHAVLIQAFLNGLLLGKLVDDRVASGVKYAAALVAVCTGVLVVAM